MSVFLDITTEVLRGLGWRELVAGDDYDMQFTAQRGGSALSLVGAKLWLTIKDDPIATDAQAKLQLTSADAAEIEITDAANGVFLVKFVGTGAKSTADLEGLWKYDIQVLMSGGTIITLARGAIEFLENLTRTVA